MKTGCIPEAIDNEMKISGPVISYLFLRFWSGSPCRHPKQHGLLSLLLVSHIGDKTLFLTILHMVVVGYQTGQKLLSLMSSLHCDTRYYPDRWERKHTSGFTYLWTLSATK